MGDRPSSRLVWLGFFGVILVLALLAGFAFLRGGRQLAELQVQQQAEPVQQLLYVILNGEQRVVPEAKRLQLSLDIQSAVDEEQGKLLERMRQQIDAAVDTAFAPVHDHVGDFADWYYSLTGEYMRYAHAVGGDMGEYMQQQLKETVFLPAALEANLDNMLADINARLSRDIRQSGDRLSFRRCQPWRAKRRLVDPSSREAALFSRRALRQRENKVGLRTRRPVIGSQVRSSNELAKLLRSAW